MAEKKIYFEPMDPKATILRVAHAHYARDLSAEKPPWEATQEEWEQHLFRTGLFREIASPLTPDPSREAGGVRRKGKE